jgi:hypothetical protein
MFRSVSKFSVPRGSAKVFFFRPFNMRGLTVDALNPAILNVQYAVRGELAIKAEEYRVQLKTNTAHGLPFNKIISSNIGNPQQTGLDQPPITFNRQVRTAFISFWRLMRCAGSPALFAPAYSIQMI